MNFIFVERGETKDLLDQIDEQYVVRAGWLDFSNSGDGTEVIATSHILFSKREMKDEITREFTQEYLDEDSGGTCDGAPFTQEDIRKFLADIA